MNRIYRLLVCLIVGVALCASGGNDSRAADCNGNGVDDAKDILPARFGFDAPIEFAPFGVYPGPFALGDFNGDGVLDAAISWSEPPAWEGCRGGCPGGFVFALRSAEANRNLLGSTFDRKGYTPTSVTVGDLDGDLDLDVVGVDPSGVQVFLNRGMGAFEEPVQYTTGASSVRVIAQDLDGDDLLDLAVANQGSNSNAVSLLLNRGQGVFGTAVNLSTGDAPVSLVPIDWDSDGDMDLVTGNRGPAWDPSCQCFPGEGSLSYLENVDLDSFRTAFTEALAYHPEVIGAADLDGDGNSELIALGHDACTGDRCQHAVHILRHSEAEALPFVETSIHTIQETSALPLNLKGSLAAADVENDGDLDIVASVGLGGSQSIALLVNTGGEIFSPASVGPTQFIVMQVIAADADGDSDLDLVFTGDSPLGGLTFAYLENRESGSFGGSSPVTYSADGFVTTLAAADLNADGDKDLIAALDDGTLSVLQTQGDGSLSRAVNYPGVSPDACCLENVNLVAGDLDGDGDIDVAQSGDSSGAARGGIALFLNHGDGGFDGPAPVEGVTDSSHSALGDLDGDSDLDILTQGKLTSDGGYEARILLNDGTGRFPVAKNVQAAGLLADLDRDGDLDVLAGSDVLFNNGDATFTRGPFYDDIPVRIEDFDGDGDLDVLAQRQSNYDSSCNCFRPFSLQLYKNAGNGSFAESGEQLVLEPEESPYGPEIFIEPADLDGDHDLDLAIAIGPIDSAVRVFLNDGTGTFSPRTRYSVPICTALVAIDLNRDRLDDLVVGQYNGVSVLLNSSVRITSLDLNHNSVPDECEPHFHRGDPNSSGATDISDGIAIFGYLFLGNAAPGCLEAADADNNGSIDISDGISLLNFLFLGGPPPAVPSPPPAPCGLDPDSPGSAGDLGCETFENC